jgi:hypothetical protein
VPKCVIFSRNSGALFISPSKVQQARNIISQKNNKAAQEQVYKNNKELQQQLIEQAKEAKKIERV